MERKKTVFIFGSWSDEGGRAILEAAFCCCNSVEKQASFPKKTRKGRYGKLRVAQASSHTLRFPPQNRSRRKNRLDAEEEEELSLLFLLLLFLWGGGACLEKEQNKKSRKGTLCFPH